MPGLERGRLFSDQYYRQTAASNAVPATTTLSGEHPWWIGGAVIAALCQRRWDARRVCVCSIGHRLADLQGPQMTRIMRRGMGPGRRADRGAGRTGPAATGALSIAARTFTDRGARDRALTKGDRMAMHSDAIQDYLHDLNDRMMAQDDWGTPAGYIPELRDVDPAQFAVSVALVDGTVLSAGSAGKRFSIQSISKVFTLSIALGRLGDTLWSRVGREPSGNRFDSILQLEQEKGRPRNPFINAGAIATTDALLSGRKPKETLSEILLFIRAAAEDDDIHINKSVAQSEKDTGYRNMALAHYLKSHGNLHNHPDLTLGTYYHQCAIDMTTRQLAVAGRYLAAMDGAPRLLTPDKTRRVNALMMTCGHYDGSGDFAFRVGLPAKSGVGGGLLIIAPHKASVAIWSPGLNSYGNSKVGTEAAQRLSTDLGWSVF